MAEIYLGTSGWSYKEWEGIFYPKGQKLKLSYYAKYFKTVEIDSTFYAFPKEAMIKGCVKYTPDDFVFTAKLPGLITHDKALELEKGVKQDLEKFLYLMKPLINENKLGPLLIQLPPSFTYDNGYKKLGDFLEKVQNNVRFAVEFRNKSWLGKEEVSELLKKHGVAQTIVDEPLLPPNTNVTTNFAFVRWHGHGKRPWYNYRYSEKELEPWVTRINNISKKVDEVYGYLNNHYKGFAVENSLKMMELLNLATQKQVAMQKKVSKKIDDSSINTELTQSRLL